MRNDAAVHEMHHLILSLHPTFTITWHCCYWLQMMKTTTMAMGTSMVMTMTHHQQLLLQLPQALVSTCLLWCIAFKWCLWRVLWYTMQLCCIWFMAERHKVSTGLLTLLLLLPCTTTAMLVSDGNLSLSAGVHCRTWACHTLLCLSRHQVWTRACQYIVLFEQTPGVPQGMQASRLLCIYLLFVTQMMMVSMVMTQVQLHPLLLLVNEAFEKKGRTVPVCGPLVFVRSLWRRHW